MEEEGVVIFREQKVSVFRLPTVVISQGHYLDSWKDKIWVGELQIATNKEFLTVKLVDQTTGKLYGQSPMNNQYQQFVQKCVDSSRGYALKLVGDNDRFAWVGIGFHDRVSAFKFFSTFSDYQKILNQKNQKYEITKKDFTLKQNQKIRINTGANEIIEKQDQVQDFTDDDFQLNIKSKKQKKKQPKINLMDNETNFIQQFIFFIIVIFYIKINIHNQFIQIDFTKNQIFFSFLIQIQIRMKVKSKGILAPTASTFAPFPNNQGHIIYLNHKRSQSKDFHAGKINYSAKQKKDILDQITEYKKFDRNPKLQGVFDKAPIMNLKSNTNFIKENIKENKKFGKSKFIKKKSKIENQKTKILEKEFNQKYKSGYIPNFYQSIKSQLAEQKMNQEKENKQNNQYQVQQTQQGYFLDEEEKQFLLKKLRQRWVEINNIYQKTTHRKIYSSENQKKRKELLEKTLKEIEEDIKRINFKNLKIDTSHQLMIQFIQLQ